MKDVEAAYSPSKTNVEFLRLCTHDGNLEALGDAEDYEKVAPKCFITTSILQRDDYGEILKALKVDPILLLKHLISPSHDSIKWLNFLINPDRERYALLDVNIETGRKRKIMKSPLQRQWAASYGHNVKILIADDEDVIVKAKTYIQQRYNKRNVFLVFLWSIIHWFKNLFSHDERLKFDTDMLIDYYHPYLDVFHKAMDDLEHSIYTTKPQIIQVYHHEKPLDSRRESSHSTLLILIAIYHILELISIHNIDNSDAPGEPESLEDRYFSIQTYYQLGEEVTISLTHLIKAIAAKSTTEVSEETRTLQGNLQALRNQIADFIRPHLNTLKHNSHAAIPTLPYAPILYGELQEIVKIYQMYLTCHRGQWLFRYNDLTKNEAVGDRQVGMVFTRQLFDNVGHGFSDGGDLGLYCMLDDCEKIKNFEPMLLRNREEHKFGWITFPTEPAETESNMPSGDELIETCKCGNVDLRLWLCLQCYTVVKKSGTQEVACLCGVQDKAGLNKQCYHCMPGRPRYGEDLIREHEIYADEPQRSPIEEQHSSVKSHERHHSIAMVEPEDIHRVESEEVTKAVVIERLDKATELPGLPYVIEKLMEREAMDILMKANEMDQSEFIVEKAVNISTTHSSHERCGTGTSSSTSSSSSESSLEASTPEALANIQILERTREMSPVDFIIEEPIKLETVTVNRSPASSTSESFLEKDEPRFYDAPEEILTYSHDMEKTEFIISATSVEAQTTSVTETMHSQEYHYTSVIHSHQEATTIEILTLTSDMPQIDYIIEKPPSRIYDVPPLFRYNILLLGEVGVGKTTLINSLANYLKFASFEEAQGAASLECIVPIQFRIPRKPSDTWIIAGPQNDPSESFNKSGESVTQEPRGYVFAVNDCEMCFIDTPGFSDSRGVEHDEANLELIRDAIGGVNELHAICFLIDDTTRKISDKFETGLRRILSLFAANQSYLQKIYFFFTYSYSTYFHIEDVMIPIRELVQWYHDNDNAQIPLTPGNLYSIDNEAMRYLLAQKQGIDYPEKDPGQFKFCWEKTASELQRFFETLRYVHDNAQRQHPSVD